MKSEGMNILHKFLSNKRNLCYCNIELVDYCVNKLKIDSNEPQPRLNFTPLMWASVNELKEIETYLRTNFPGPELSEKQRNLVALYKQSTLVEPESKSLKM